ncbi:MAG: (2Fe-2S)-binding protein [Verrucomicrobia bacterium]|nr:MAG: (2Fe-2S)-binding protein [Verrucomicrobiota bacterium]
MKTSVRLVVNGRQVTVETEPDRPLLEVLREDLGLTGTKYGCGEGSCGACTVLVDDRSTHACLTPVADVAGKSVLTIEGLGADGRLHPVQEAFLAARAHQCGYCTPGMIMEIAGWLRRGERPRPEEIPARLEGHLCRCGSHYRILEAARRVLASQPVRQP